MIAIVVIAATLLAPAAVLEAPLAARTQNQVRLIESGGLWWKGQGTLALADGSVRLPVTWRVELVPLLRGLTVTHVVDAKSHAALATIIAQAQQVDVRNARVRVPAQVVGAFDPRLQGMTVGGSIVVDAPSFGAGKTASGQLRVAWERARIVAGDTVIDLGTVAMVATPSGDGWAATVGNTGGDVAVTGTLNARRNGIDVALSLRPTAATPSSVREMLPLLGSLDGSGAVRIAWHRGPPP